jgi:hypothetical protein
VVLLVGCDDEDAIGEILGMVYIFVEGGGVSPFMAVQLAGLFLLLGNSGHLLLGGVVQVPNWQECGSCAIDWNLFWFDFGVLEHYSCHWAADLMVADEIGLGGLQHFDGGQWDTDPGEVRLALDWQADTFVCVKLSCLTVVVGLGDELLSAETVGDGFEGVGFIYHFLRCDVVELVLYLGQCNDIDAGF